MLNTLDFSKAVDYHYDRFPPQTLDYNRLMASLLSATDALARYDQMLKNLHNSEILLAPLRNQEAIISSRMEGTISTLDEILQYEADFAENEMPSEVRSDIIETVLYQRALKNAQRAMKEGYPLSKSLIKTLHQQLLSSGRGATKSPGQFKNEQNYLADRNKKTILFVPISPEKLEQGLDNLFEYINHNPTPILPKTAITHLEFEALHPFQDGNGRIGRMLITLMLWRAGAISEPHFYISGYFEEHKEEYLALMRQVSENGDWVAWCEFFLQAIANQAHYNLTIAQNISDLYEKMKPIFSETLSSKWAMTVLDFVFTYPVFRGNQLSEKTEISPASANRFVRTLHDKGILMLKEESAGRKSALYSFEPMMNLVRV
ncbi:Fic family protein [Gallibacterium anatis]|uniref:Protein adenylyltransferase n=1 Tax=Gallibacterium anatis TaxID=750 RepID=A0A0A3APN5_9PAST|nr:Fic family protein [Gallibacterium anatis]KGQ53015.1 cell division protein Fic [Gallibacterium anatis DSM 16844 = F 149]KGQ62297.1 cell division protein Fic [Gallibacterium anatis]KGQ69050.1 cell division protein Fic [Gallibacterium anatis]WIM81933.1 Fic family protein [Gallibacterium anatis]STO39140.1 Protein involved in cell division [Gallibacterium anatis]